MVTWTAEEVKGLGRRTRPLFVYWAFGPGDWAPSADPIPWEQPLPVEDLPACMRRIVTAAKGRSVSTIARAMDQFARTRDAREAIGVARAYIPSWRLGDVSFSSVVLQRLPSLEDPPAWILMRAAVQQGGGWYRGVVQVQSCRTTLRLLREVGREVRPVVPMGSWWLKRAPGWARRALRRMTSRWAEHPSLAVLGAVATEHGIDVYEQGVEVLAWAGTCAAAGWPLDGVACLAEAIGSGLIPIARVDDEVVCVRHPGTASTGGE